MTKLETYLSSLTRSQRNLIVGVSWSGDLIDPCFDVVYLNTTDNEDPEWSFHIAEELEKSDTTHFFLSHGYTRETEAENLDHYGNPIDLIEVLPHNDITVLGVQDLNRIELETLPPFLTPVEKFLA